MKKFKFEKGISPDKMFSKGNEVMEKMGVINVKLTRWDTYLGGGYAIQYEWRNFPGAYQNTFEKGDLLTAYESFVDKVINVRM